MSSAEPKATPRSARLARVRTPLALLAVLLGGFGILSVHAFGPGYEPSYAASGEGFLHTGVPQLWRSSPNYGPALGGTPTPPPGPVYPGPTMGWAGPVGASLLVAPAMALDALRARVKGSDSSGFRKAAASLYARILIALTALLVFWLALQLYGSPRRALLLALAFGFTTLALPYTRIGMEPPLVFWTTAAFCAAFQARRSDATWWWLAAGVAAGFAAGTRNPAAPVLIAPLFAYALWPLVRGGAGLRLSRIALYLAPVVASGIASMAYNVTRCDAIVCGLSAQVTGNNTNPGGLNTDKARLGVFEGIYGLLLSPGKSFFLASPLVILGAIGLWRARHRLRAETLAVVGMAGVALLLLSPLSYWSEETYGPRYVLFVVPLFVVFAGVALGWSAAVPVRRLVRRGVLIALIVGGAVYQLGAIVPQGGHSPCASYFKPLVGDARFDQNYCRFVPELSDPVLGARMAVANLKNMVGLGTTTLTYEPYVGAPGGIIEQRTLVIAENRPRVFWLVSTTPTTLSLLFLYVLVTAGGVLVLRRTLDDRRSVASAP